MMGVIIQSAKDFKVIFFEKGVKVLHRIVSILRKNIDRIEKEDERNKEACLMIRHMPYRITYVVILKEKQVMITIQTRKGTARIYKLPEDVNEEILKVLAVSML